MALQMVVFSAIASLALTLVAFAPGAEAAKKRKQPVAPLTTHQMPLVCGQVWTGSTRAAHSPSAKSVDFNRANDKGLPALASAAGTVTTAQTSPSGGYGRYVVLDHGAGESTLYAHLDAVSVSVGQRVDMGTQIGRVGDSGRVTGAHLHYEQKKGKAVQDVFFGGRLYRYGTSASANCVDVPLSATTNSAVDRPALYRRAATSSFLIRTGATTTRTVVFGAAADEPLVGDWNGDRTSDVGVRKAGTAVFQLKTGTAAPVQITYGLATDVPISGDWDGDGRWEIGVYRPSAAAFLLRLDNGQTLTVPVPGSGVVPLTGDFDGDGATDVAVYGPASRTFTLRTVLNDRITWSQHSLGAAGDLPLVGDWNGDGLAELGTWTPRTAAFTTYQGSFVPLTTGAARTAMVTKAKRIVWGKKRR